MGAAPTYWNPGGRRSVTSTPVAPFGPWLSTDTVTSIVSPARTSAGADFVTSTSASRTSAVEAVAELFAVSGSVAALDTVAVLTMGAGDV